jgi:shikimate dehydrogenase
MYYLLGLIGHPVSHSLSPAMHKAALSHYALAGDYKLVDLPPDALAEGIRKLVAEGYAGFNVTVPHKVAAAKLMQSLTTEATQLKAINTVRINSDGSLTGHNTDLGGFMVALSAAWPLGAPGQCALVVGAGGAARSGLAGLIRMGWPDIKIAARNLSAADALAGEISEAMPASLKIKSRVEAVDCAWQGQCDLLVNCTPIGLKEGELPDWLVAQVANVRQDGLVFDMVYSRSGASTPLVRLAREGKISAVDGVDMLVNQAALAFNFWTGKAGPVEVMHNALATHPLTYN